MRHLDVLRLFAALTSDARRSYPDELQTSPIFKHIGSRGYFWYLLFQCFVVDAVDGTNPDVPHFNRSMIIGGDG